MSVPARITVITLGAQNLPAPRSFYAGFGWELADPEGNVSEWAPPTSTMAERLRAPILHGP
jgi:hypothetical protein